MKSQTCPKVVIFAIIIVFFFPVVIQAQRGDSCSIDKEGRNKMKALKLKIAAIISILLAGSMGICIPILGKRIPALKPEKDLFFLVKSFAAGVILATGLVHILPDAFDNLTSPCLKENPWGNFPFSGFICMVSAIATLMVDTFATSYYKKSQTSKASLPVNDGEVQVEMHTHASHGHAHGAILSSQGHIDGFSNHGVESSEFLRHRVISQVLELGILVHSVIIGVSLGTSENPATIKPLVAALSFHQFFEGAGLGGCIVQAKFKGRAMAIMALFFSLTTPFGIALGIGISSVYNENSPTALIVEGIFNSSASGILIYMALVDLLAADFMHPRMQDNGKLQVWANISLLMGSGLMSLMAKWA